MRISSIDRMCQFLKKLATRVAKISQKLAPEPYFVNNPTKEVDSDTRKLKINGAINPVTANPGT